MENLDNNPMILTCRCREAAVSLGYIDESTTMSRTANRIPSTWFHDYSRVLQHIYTGSLFAVCTTLIGLIQVKFQNEKQSPFETHIFFVTMSVVALPLAIITSGILFYTNDPFEKSKINFKPVHYTLLKIVFSFSTILAPLSLVPILFIPPQLNWIGYLIIYAIFAVTVAYNVLGYKKLLEKKELPNLGAHQMV